MPFNNETGSRTTSQQSSFIGENKRNPELTITSSSGEGSSFLQKSEFLDPLVRINKMKFLTSPDIRIANQTRFAILDIRLRKLPKLTEIFKKDNPMLPQRAGLETIPVFEVDL